MGKLIVLEGIDGSGKSTQFKLLTERLAREGLAFRTVRFPRYDNDSSALLRMYLAGDFGTRPDDVNAYAASAFFAVDRYASYKTESWGAFLDAGGVVLTDRYTTSNAIHQGAKLKKPERQAFFRWIYEFEFGQMGLPRPTAVIYHDINAGDAIERIKTRDGAADIHENDADYLAKCADCAGEAACILGWIPVDAFRSEAEIHEEIYALVRGEFQ